MKAIKLVDDKIITCCQLNHAGNRACAVDKLDINTTSTDDINDLIEKFVEAA